MSTGDALAAAAATTMCLMLAAGGLRRFRLSGGRMAGMALIWLVIFAVVMALGVFLKR